MVERHKKDLRTLDPTSSEYWEEVLRREGLTMDAGRSKKEVHVGSSSDLGNIYEMTQDLSGRVHARRGAE